MEESKHEEVRDDDDADGSAYAARLHDSHDSHFDIDFASAYLDTTYADPDKIIACIDKVAGECQLIGFTMLPRDAKGRNIDERLIKLSEYLGQRSYKHPQEYESNYYASHAGVYTRFYPLARDT